MTGPAASASTTLATLATLRARTKLLERDIDLVRFAGPDGVLWCQNGIGFAGRGVAARITIDEADEARLATELLTNIQTDGGGGPIAFGALPFNVGMPGVHAELVIPEMLVRRLEDGSMRLTVTGKSDSPAEPAQPLADDRGSEPDEFSVTPTASDTQWRALVREALAMIAGERLTKVVLAREVIVRANRALDPVRIAQRLGVAYPSCTLFAAPGFVGASPELLVTRQGARVLSHPLAGTGRHAGALLGSDKEQREHGLVVEAVAGTLNPLCTTLVVPDHPSAVDIGGLVHLGTPIEGRLREPMPTALELALALHPTPAVAGAPTAEARAFIATHEGIDRGRYAGPVGWVDAVGDGAWAIAIRSAELSGNQAHLFAGAGIVAGSVPDAELDETQLKLQPLLSAIARP